MKNSRKTSPPTIVGEMACAHGGNLGSILKMIEAAAHSQVDVIQLQFFQIDKSRLLVQPNFHIHIKSID